MSELQQEAAEAPAPEATEQATETPIESPNGASDSAPEAGSEPEKITFDERQQEEVNRIVGQKVAKQREAERKAQELESQLEQAKASIPQPTAPAVPGIPDRYDYDSDSEFQAALAERDSKLREAVAFEQQANIQQQLQQQQQLAEQQKQAEQFNELAGSYSERGKKLGLKAEDLQQAGQALAHAGVSGEIATFLLKDEDGPLISSYLARNPLALEQATTLSPMEAAIWLDSEVRQKAQAVKPKTTQAPPPSESINGGLVPDKGNPLLKGAKFE